MRMLCICAKAEPTGYLAIRGKPLDANGVAKAAAISAAEAATLMDELDRWGIFSRDRKGRIYSRRMVRDAKRAKEGQKHARKRWPQDAETKQKKSAPNGLPNGHPMTHKPEAIPSKDSEPNGSGASPPTFREMIFGDGLTWLAGAADKPKDRLRSLAGKWCSEFGDELTMAAIAEAQKNTPVDPIAWITRRLRGAKPTNPEDDAFMRAAHSVIAGEQH